MTTLSLKKAPQTYHNALISSEIMTDLINLSGRQRMLSQRVALNVALAANGHSEGLNEAKTALTLFKQTHTNLVHGNQEYPGIFFDALEKAFFGNDQNELKIQAFIRLAEHAIAQYTHAHNDLTPTLLELGSAANSIVPILNKITIAYEQESNHQAAAIQKQHQRLMGDIQKIAKEAKIVSFNAQVIAARAGENGKEFAVVAGVMTDITEEIDKLVLAALNNE